MPGCRDQPRAVRLADASLFHPAETRFTSPAACESLWRHCSHVKQRHHSNEVCRHGVSRQTTKQSRDYVPTEDTTNSFDTCHSGVKNREDREGTSSSMFAPSSLTIHSREVTAHSKLKPPSYHLTREGLRRVLLRTMRYANMKNTLHRGMPQERQRRALCSTADKCSKEGGRRWELFCFVHRNLGRKCPS